MPPCSAAADALRAAEPEILAANAQDLAAASGTRGVPRPVAAEPGPGRGDGAGLEEVAALPDPLDRTLAEWTRPNGLRIRRIAAPIGVIGMIYESRPNVGADAAGLCLKSGNAVILRGGSDSLHSAARDPRRDRRRAARGRAARGCGADRPRPPTAASSPPCWRRPG